MISLAITAGLLLAGSPADDMGSARRAYSACIKALSELSLGKKTALAEFNSAVSTSCAQQEAAFRGAVIAEQMSMKASRKDAEQAAADWVSDFRMNASENYKNGIGDEANPIT